MRMILKTLELKNFKGIRDIKVDFDCVETSIFGENATGKTSIADAFSWLLFDKDTQGKSPQTFEIKTKENGQVINGLDHEVHGVFEVDGKPLTLRKIYKEIWTKKRGTKTETFSGHETEHFINDVPVKKGEYTAKISELIDEKIFPMITDPMFFASVMNWKDRRAILFEMMNGDITAEDIIKENKTLKPLLDELEGKTIEELQKQYAYQKKELNKKLEDIPVRIDTLQETIKEVDMEALNLHIRSKKGSITKIEEMIADAGSMNDERLKKQEEIYEKKSRLKEIEANEKEAIKDPNRELKIKIDSHNQDKQLLEKEVIRLERQKAELELQIQQTEKKVQQYREEFHNENANKIDFSMIQTACPTCLRPFDDYVIDEKREEFQKNFNELKAKKLEDIRAKGKKEAERKEELEKEIQELQPLIDEKSKRIVSLLEESEALQKQISDKQPESLEERILKNEEYQKILSEIEVLEASIKDENQQNEVADLKNKKRELEEAVKLLEKDLHQEEINLQTKEKIQSLMDEEKEVNGKIAVIEKMQDLAEKFIRARAELIERNINSKFDNVEFKLFDIQVNGGIAETCEVLVKGISFNDGANTAGRINAGLDIINALCRHYEVNAPIWIDNRESTNHIIPVDSQVINLIVSKDKELRIEVEERKVA